MVDIFLQAVEMHKAAEHFFKLQVLKLNCLREIGVEVVIFVFHSLSHSSVIRFCASFPPKSGYGFVIFAVQIILVIHSMVDTPEGLTVLIK